MVSNSGFGHADDDEKASGPWPTRALTRRGSRFAQPTLNRPQANSQTCGCARSVATLALDGGLNDFIHGLLERLVEANVERCLVRAARRVCSSPPHSDGKVICSHVSSGLKHAKALNHVP